MQKLRPANTFKVKGPAGGGGKEDSSERLEQVTLCSQGR